MHQFKEKVGKDRELASAALFYYPVLMAADVLAYRATEVPVGDDQRQHVELMREIARRFNARFGETLVVPELVIPEVGARIMDLQEPERKMSTTGGTEQRDGPRPRRARRDPQEVRLSAVTDSGREVVRSPEKAGITNLIDILAVARGSRPGGGRERVRGRRLRRLQEGGRRGGGRAAGAGAASATPSCAPTRPTLERILAARRREGAGDGRPGRRRRARADGLRPGPSCPNRPKTSGRPARL